MSLIFTPEFPPVPGKIETVDEKGIHHLGPNNGVASGEPDQSYTDTVIDLMANDLMAIDLMANAYREGVNEAK